MRRKLFAVLSLIMVFALLISACTPKVETPAVEETEEVVAPVEETTEETTTEETTEETVEETVEASIWDGVTPAKNIVFWHQHTGEAREAAMQKIVDGFNETNEYGITLTAEYAGGYGDIYTKMLAILNTPPDVPDIVVGYQNQIATYQLADSFFDMNTVINDPVYGMPRKIRMTSSLLSSSRMSIHSMAIRDWALPPQPLHGSHVLQHGLAERIGL